MPGQGSRAAIVGVALWLFSSLGAASQTRQPPSDPSPRLIPRTQAEREQRFLTQHRIILNAEVADASGKATTDLQPADFTLYDNDQPRKLVSLSRAKGDSASAATHVVIVLDAVNNFSRPLRTFGRAIEEFLSQGNGPLAYPLSIGLFSGASINVGTASRDRDALLADLKRRAGDLHATGCIIGQDSEEPMKAQNFGGGPGAGYRAETTRLLNCLNDRFVASVNALHRFAQAQVDVPGRVILIWMGPGWPLLTNRSFTPDPPEVKQSFFEQLVALSMALREAQVTVDAVASPHDLPYPQAPPETSFFDDISNEDQIKAGNLGLHALAHQTGGRIVTYANGIDSQIRDCIADAASYYVLTFDSPPAAGFGEYHSLAVKIDKPGLEVRTNTLYYAEQ